MNPIIDKRDVKEGLEIGKQSIKENLYPTLITNYKVKLLYKGMASCTHYYLCFRSHLNESSLGQCSRSFLEYLFKLYAK